ncbi:2-dehydro-3-deoxygalactonokinase [Tropicibacter sp. Alg240-R139]|uniref:2-dehydro-3-deoxygalactonokinase n=1 Tax=Tropicibacter sp. Alg240-R139 TaxID=2305991 RepID=UPI0013DF37EC|nr:2-dehydro-3-deoxygalactonokinase [Tropicibacter sp. Alg240-R139]
MNSVASDAALIGLDWGTSSLRAFLINSDGDILDEVSTSQGIMNVKGRDFDAAFHDLIGAWVDETPLPVIASGMITSRNGWVETPYVQVPAGKNDLAKVLVPFKSSKGISIQFVTGMTAEHDGAPDVMRGEETQIIGAAAMGLGDGIYVLPGTHSKWLVVKDGGIEDYKTYMTGELFAALKGHTILGTLMKDGEFSEEGFRIGVNEGLSAAGDLLNTLFHVRTMPLFEKISAEMAADYLSGMLIGAEISSGSSDIEAGQVTIVGRGDLADRYEIALSVAGHSSRRAPSNICARGHFEIAKSAGLLS